MKHLIKINSATIGNQLIQSVSARELYLGLGLDKSNWTRWSKQNIEDNEFFAENVDWSGFVIMTNGNETKDYAISLEFAKHIAMMCKSQKGHEYRSYFLECEKIATSKQTTQLPSFKEAIEGVEVLANYLRLPDSGRIALVAPVVKQYGVNVALPTYAIDAPSTSITGSSMPTNSATELLKEHGLKLSTLAFNKLLETNGFIETLTRKSSKGDKHYKSITAKGLAYGKNITSTSNTKETQPHWYIGKFSELLDAVMVS